MDDSTNDVSVLLLARRSFWFNCVCSFILLVTVACCFPLLFLIVFYARYFGSLLLLVVADAAVGLPVDIVVGVRSVCSICDARR